MNPTLINRPMDVVERTPIEAEEMRGALPVQPNARVRQSLT
jgi:hypothetical protein